MMIPLTQRTETELVSFLAMANANLSMTINSMGGMGLFRDREYYLKNHCYSAAIRGCWNHIFQLELELNSRTLSASV